ncbi:MAG: dipeptide/oligopeptide/nickel ABC transporter ATP-binding protein [Acidobacteria bacterium]|jgi:ABC-type glutathione transport system ATPase component|nr:dipeptide/oligopeptide/nickel ABC transporter ATP-binding protein [Acidobacteriota bacterium]
MTTPRFRLRGIGKSYRGPRRGTAVRALDWVDLDIDEGQVNALLGSSGAGKSTLARIVIGFDSPDHGVVNYQGRPFAEVPRGEFCRRNQMVFQNPQLAMNPLFTVERIIGEPLRTMKIPAAVALQTPSPGSGERIAKVMEWLELSRAFAGRLPHELSGGELQRVALARALVLEPDFLVLDEPFSALDDLTAMKVLLLVKGLFRRLGLGALFVSHHPRHVAALADRVSVLEKGRIAG